MEWIEWYGIGISVIAIVAAVYDKRAARHGWQRIRERTLFGIATVGGALAMYVAMCLVRHKTKHKRFMIGLPLITAVQVALWLWFVMGR